jgi:hypothetical protein
MSETINNTFFIKVDSRDKTTNTENVLAVLILIDNHDTSRIGLTKTFLNRFIQQHRKPNIQFHTQQFATQLEKFAKNSVLR